MNLNRIDRDRGTAELDYWIAVPFWGRGIATAAVRLAVTLAFAGLRLQVVESVCLEENPASGRVLEKAGFTEVESGTHADRYGSRFAKRSFRRFRLQRETWIAQGAAGTGNS
jgi:RimJ/RimL family protein N-acetyltransferase